MSRYAVKVYEGCPIATILWNIVSLIGLVSGIMGFTSLIFVFFPGEETDPQLVLRGALIGIPLFLVCLILQKLVDKMGRKQIQKKSEEREAGR